MCIGVMIAPVAFQQALDIIRKYLQVNPLWCTCKKSLFFPMIATSAWGILRMCYPCSMQRHIITDEKCHSFTTKVAHLGDVITPHKPSIMENATRASRTWTFHALSQISAFLFVCVTPTLGLFPTILAQWHHWNASLRRNSPLDDAQALAF